ncbi:MAG: hypothetical protein Q9163_004663 [Psora crenata]
MKAPQSGLQHQRFMQWAKDRGVTFSGVCPGQTQGSGVGIVADRRIEAGEKLVSVPREALFGIQSIPKKFQKRHGDITVHGLLASFLAFGGPEKVEYDSWKSTWPSAQDFKESMPLLWPSVLKGPFTRGANDCNSFAGYTFFPLPPAIGGGWTNNHSRSDDASLLRRQEAKLRRDWKIVSATFPNGALEDYVYHWLAVNTRCLYYVMPGAKVLPQVDDRIVLCPFIDYFNHQDHGCIVASDERGFTVTSDRVYDAGEEIFTSYGGHSNDFLLVEYGFFLERNRWDTLPLDHLITQVFIDEGERKRLADAGYLGGKWEEYVAGKSVQNEQDDAEADVFVAMRILRVYYDEAKAASEELDKVGASLPSCQRQTLLIRWKQIKFLIQQAFTNGISRNIQAMAHAHFDLPAPRTVK